MEEFDFSECKFIDENMRFYTYYDFCDDRKLIKILYKSLSSNGKLFYRWYVYSNIHMNETYKNYIWDYINDYISDIDVLNAKRFYKAR